MNRFGLLAAWVVIAALLTSSAPSAWSYVALTLVGLATFGSGWVALRLVRNAAESD
jgi:hypothetical protein